MKNTPTTPNTSLAATDPNGSACPDGTPHNFQPTGVETKAKHVGDTAKVACLNCGEEKVG
jgi:hypothetical protein